MPPGGIMAFVDGTLTALVFGLDPSEGQTFEDVRECALIVYNTLQGLGIRSYAKTSELPGCKCIFPRAA